MRMQPVSGAGLPFGGGQAESQRWELQQRMQPQDVSQLRRAGPGLPRAPETSGCQACAQRRPSKASKWPGSPRQAVERTEGILLMPELTSLGCS